MSWRKELRDWMDGILGGPYSGGVSGLFGPIPSESGADVNETSAMTVGAVAACQRIISSAIASMSCYIYERMPDGGHRLAVNHPLFDILSLRPSSEYPAVDFYSAGQVNLLQNGNAYAEVLTNGAGQPAELRLLSPFRTQPFRQNDGALAYRTTDNAHGVERIIEAAAMIHVKNMGVTPYVGLSPIRLYMREVIGTALAAQAYGARLFKNDARPGGYLKSALTVKPEDKLKQVQSWLAGHRGGNNHTPAYLDGGVEWAQVGINPDEAQFLQTRQFQRSEIASIYGVPAHMLGDPQETKATIEQKALEFLLWTVKIWLRRWEHSFNVKLFPTKGQTAGKYFAKFDTSEFERADYATMLKGIQTGRYSGLISLDEGRKLLGLNPTTADNFDEKKPGAGLWRPVNMAVAGEDPAVYSSGGAAGDGSGDAPADDAAVPGDAPN
jgi:HK97 family phage portal protein